MNIEFNGLRFKGEYYRETMQTYWHPGEPADFEIEEVWHGKENITEAFWQLEDFGLDILKIQEQLAEKATQSIYESQLDYLEYQRQDR